MPLTYKYQVRYLSSGQVRNRYDDHHYSSLPLPYYYYLHDHHHRTTTQSCLKGTQRRALPPSAPGPFLLASISLSLSFFFLLFFFPHSTLSASSSTRYNRGCRVREKTRVAWKLKREGCRWIGLKGRRRSSRRRNASEGHRRRKVQRCKLANYLSPPLFFLVFFFSFLVFFYSVFLFWLSVCRPSDNSLEPSRFPPAAVARRKIRRNVLHAARWRAGALVHWHDGDEHAQQAHHAHATWQHTIDQIQVLCRPAFHPLPSHFGTCCYVFPITQSMLQVWQRRPLR
ncbi:hypothetical protein F5Y14DRAFT_216973 [Nemania sp. NC0429]|nr:hypothetical protein F5Y14DRAFT_216973 [Nemania sp. NC0429]